MPITNPPCLFRKAGVQGSVKAWSLTPTSRPVVRRRASAALKVSERRLAPMGSSRYITRSLVTGTAMGISAGFRAGKLERIAWAHVTTPLTPELMSSARS